MGLVWKRGGGLRCIDIGIRITRFMKEEGVPYGKIWTIWVNFFFEGKEGERRCESFCKKKNRLEVYLFVFFRDDFFFLLGGSKRMDLF